MPHFTIYKCRGFSFPISHCILCSIYCTVCKITISSNRWKQTYSWLYTISLYIHTINNIKIHACPTYTCDMARVNISCGLYILHFNQTGGWHVHIMLFSKLSMYFYFFPYKYGCVKRNCRKSIHNRMSIKLISVYIWHHSFHKENLYRRGRNKQR